MTVTLSDEAIERAAACLQDARRQVRQIDALPDGAMPGSDEEGYRIQEALLVESGDVAAGYKIGATSKRAQDFLGTDGPFYGRLRRGALLDSGVVLARRDLPFYLLEPEFAFRMGEDLPSRDRTYDRDEVTAAVATVIPAIEVVTSVWREWNQRGVPALIADNGVHGLQLLGPEFPKWRELDLADHQVRLRVDGRQAGEGRGANALGHPLAALTWLANALRARDRGIKAGEIVTTGVVTPFVTLERGSHAEADFGELGSVTVNLTA